MKQKSLIQHMNERNAMQLGGDEPKGKTLQKTEIKNPVKEEMEERKYAKSPTAKYEGSEFEKGVKKEIRDKYERRDSDIKNTVEKGKMQSEINYLRKREKELGGKRKVDKTIKNRQRNRKIKNFITENAWPIATGVGGTAAMIYSTVQSHKQGKKYGKE
jgi:hypothetical protein